MYLKINFLSLFVAFLGVRALEDGCPKGEVACLDVMNSSQCIEQLILENSAPVTNDALVKCVVNEGSASELPGETKYCRCPGCHSAPINAKIAELFPAPCS